MAIFHLSTVFSFLPTVNKAVKNGYFYEYAATNRENFLCFLHHQKEMKYNLDCG